MLTVVAVGVVLTVVAGAATDTTVVVMGPVIGIAAGTTGVTTMATGMAFRSGLAPLLWLAPTTPTLHPGTLAVVAGIGPANVVPTGTHGATSTAA